MNWLEQHLSPRHPYFSKQQQIHQGWSSCPWYFLVSFFVSQISFASNTHPPCNAIYSVFRRSLLIWTDEPMINYYWKEQINYCKILALRYLTVSARYSAGVMTISSRRGGAAISRCGQGSNPLPFSLCISSKTAEFAPPPNGNCDNCQIETQTTC